MTGVIVEKIESIMLCGCNEVNLTFLSSLSILAHCALLERAEKKFLFCDPQEELGFLDEFLLH